VTFLIRRRAIKEASKSKKAGKSKEAGKSLD
jgi:hypothetical protein